MKYPTHPVDAVEQLKARFEPFHLLARHAWEQHERETALGDAVSELAPAFEVNIARALIAFAEDIDHALGECNQWNAKMKAIGGYSNVPVGGA